MEIISKSEVGNVREINQDYVQCQKISDDECFVVLCDGMGGHKAGEVASLMTCEDLMRQFETHEEFNNDEEVEMWMKNAINHANHLLMEKSVHHSKFEGMGTTVVMAYVKNNQLYVSHVGDSRAYFYQDHLIQLTKDDTLVNTLVDNGTITKDEALFHPRKNILLQAVGATDVLKISFYKQEFKEGLLLLCSDGLYNSLYEEHINSIFNEGLSIEKVADELMRNALTLGGNDNISFIIIDKGVLNNEPDK